MASLTENQKKLMDKLAEMFQFDQADLDFGIYRIMNYKRDEIRRFLENDLMSQISEKLAVLAQSSNKAELEKIEKDIKNAQAMDLDEDIKAGMIGKLQEKKAAYTVNTDITAVEADIYSHLTEFFSRYYDEGDFISQRRYKDGVYAIPYEGEEVKLHWANADQYYVKTSEYFKDYTFKTPFGQTVHFKIKEAETEKDNNKSNEKRFFQLHREAPFTLENGELIIYFEYKNGDKKKQADYNIEVIAEFTKAAAQYPDFAGLLTVNDGKTLLERQLNRYTARNTFDYFIHKELGKFLNRELDFYIKNEVIFLDDIDEQDERKTKEYLLKAKVIRSIGKKIIAFLAQIEDFQKMLWLKKKFVVETNYCITLDRVPKKLYPQIIENKAQVEEWVRLFAIDEIEAGQPNLVEAPKAGFSDPLTIEFLEQNPYLVLDTGFFDAAFKEKLIDSIDGLDETLDGLIIHSENSQALNLIQSKYATSLKSVFIDPPYNTGDDGFVYKDNLQSSSWLSMVTERIDVGMRLLEDDGVMFTCIGDEEQEYLAAYIRERYSKERFFATLVWEKKKKGSFLSGNIAKMKDYILCVAKDMQNFNGLIGEIVTETETYPCVNASNPREIRNIKSGIKSKYRDADFTLPAGHTISAGNMTLVLRSEMIVRNNVLVKPFSIEGNWRYSQENMNDYADKGELYITQDLYLRRIVSEPRYKRMKDLLLRMGESNEGNFRDYDINNLSKHGWGTNEDANDELQQVLGEQYVVSYPKPSKLITLLLASLRDKSGTYIDYFAGSGTTGQAIINLNRSDNGKRKYILVEMASYFDGVILPRMKKVVYSEDWRDGKPVSRKGSSHAFKYLRLESYEDTLNNIEIEEGTLKFLDNPAVKEQYMLHYLLPNETRDSVSLLNIDMLEHPFDYAMNITRRQESKVTVIDLVETFNYLIGLKVERSFARQGFDAEFTTGEYGAVTARLKSGSAYRFKMVEGTTLSGDRVLVIWRDLTGDKIKDNAVLDAFFQRKKISTTDFEYKKIYVNGDNNLPNLRTDEESWKVVLIEEEMKKRMFSTENF